MKKGEIYLASFRYEDMPEIKKIRPTAILVVSKDDTSFYGIKLTSTARPQNKYNYKIDNWKVAGLNHQTYAECNRIEYLTDDDLVKSRRNSPIKIGELSANDCKNINNLCFDYVSTLQEKIKPPVLDTIEAYQAEIARIKASKEKQPAVAHHPHREEKA